MSKNLFQLGSAKPEVLRTVSSTHFFLRFFLIPFLLEGCFLTALVLKGLMQPLSLSHSPADSCFSLSLSLSLCVSMTLSPEDTGPAPTGRRVVSSPQAQSCSYFWRLTALSDADAFAALSVSIGMNHT